ncbi:GAF domain-containing protein [Lacticaseibacillus kribbianus]|uniref:GAF domain-containing protein n=1 Tax=Lacticaseibacillus kribbianus TaxID=2926292 RepID=UPI001CD573E3|nr:GAF domain-containing protein [Lacticaseibacillus kribbianus]
MTVLDPIVVAQVDALLEGEPNPVTNLANAAALLYNSMADLNWCGFYLYSKRTGTLDLGPFQGQVACMHIQPGSGVVGTSFAKGESLLVPDVHAFAGHIACDAASNSEVVVPLVVGDRCVGILDLDSPSLDRFTAADQATLTAFAAALAKHLDADALALVY